MRHMAEAVGAAAELWRDVRPEAVAKRAKHGCVRAQVDHQSRTACTKIRYGSVAWYWSVQQTMRSTYEACSTNEQFATKPFMERYDNKQDRSSADKYLREVSRLSVG